MMYVYGICMVICSINSALVKFDKEAEDDVVYRQQVIDEVYGSRDIIYGNEIRELLYRYTTNTTVKVVDSEYKRLYEEGVFEEEDYLSFYSIHSLDFYLEKAKFIEGLERKVAYDLLNRTVMEATMTPFMQEFSQLMMNEMLELLNSRKMKEPEIPSAPELNIGDLEDVEFENEAVSPSDDLILEEEEDSTVDTDAAKDDGKKTDTDL